MPMNLTIRKSMPYIFIAVLLIALQLAIYFLRLKGYSLGHNYNTIGFVTLIGSLPWSYPFVEYIQELTATLGVHNRNVLLVFVISIGFAINIFLLKVIYQKIKSLKYRGELKNVSI